MVLNYNLTLSNDTIAMYVSIFACAMYALTNLVRVWISSANAAAVAAKGFRFVQAPSNSFYLVRSPGRFRTSLLVSTSPALNGMNRIAAPVAGWVTTQQAIVGASPSRHGRMYVLSPSTLEEPSPDINCERRPTLSTRSRI